ncbi:ATP-dependent helicase C-terminal domain-containing protein, partial [uncultured Brevundimonas sp.]|uniref:ATP-dependent helicase C-terminal domain-containing protein n=1 Tax=uncultured Brevundimonas sp. TaxID=213418 RepID=UPI0025FA48A0
SRTRSRASPPPRSATASLDAGAVDGDLARMITVEDRLARKPSGRSVIRRSRRIGAIVLDEKVVGAPDAKTLTAALRAEVEAEGLGALTWGEQASGLRARLAFLHDRDPVWPSVSDEALLAAREAWLWPLLNGAKSLSGIGDGRLAEALRGLIPWDLQRRLDELAPTRLVTPLGSAAIDYAAEGGPRVDIRVQELFGVTTHPTVANGAPLTLALLSPARRPVQVTKDLPRFWAGSWAAVRAEMRGRYPRHPWPENPAEAQATNRAKPRGT